jgi:tRNA1(Val) A37 N6-methylase TrmN6
MSGIKSDKRIALERGQQTTSDEFLGGKLKIIQPSEGPKGAIDALFLAAAVPGVSGQRALDVGSGIGLVALALARRVVELDVTGVELQPDLCRLAHENACANGLDARVNIIEADVTAPLSTLESVGLIPESFHHVAANPPFFIEGRARSPRDAATARSRVGSEDALEKWIRFAVAMAAPRGTLTLIHRADALPDILRHMDRRFGALKLSPLFPSRGSTASRVIVQGVKGSNAPLALHDGLVLHNGAGGYTDEAQAILREGFRLDLGCRLSKR